MPQRAQPSTAAVTVALLLVYVLWGSTYLAIRIVVEEAPPLVSMGGRYALAGVLLGLIVGWRKGFGQLRITWRQSLGCALLGLLLPFLGNGMVAIAESQGATSGYTALLVALTPLMIVVYRVASGDIPRGRTILGVLGGFCGLVVLLVLGRGGAEPIPLGAGLLVMFAASCWALGSWLQPRLWLPEDAFVVTVYEMFYGGLLMLAAGAARGESLSPDYSARTWWALVYLLVFGSIVGFTAYVWLLAHAPISLVATYAYVNPVIAVFLGWLILSERPEPWTLLGGAVVVGAVAVVIASERRVLEVRDGHAVSASR